MYDLLVVKCLQAEYHLVENRPDIVFFGKSRGLLGIIDFCLKITVITILHNDAKT